MAKQHLLIAFLVASAGATCGFIVANQRLSAPKVSTTRVMQSQTSTADLKAKLLELLRSEPTSDPILVDPTTKQAVTIKTTSKLLFGEETARVQYELVSGDNRYLGSTDDYINLLEPAVNSTDASSTIDGFVKGLVSAALPFVAPPFRYAFAAAGLADGEDFVPMRDLFTSPSVSFAYENGWRQGFASAGFPGVDREYQIASDYFKPAMDSVDPSERILVDMSCATGLFTRRFAKSGNYTRVLGCDYSPSMLTEARRRIKADPALSANRLEAKKTKLDLVRCDVGRIPIKDDSIAGLHAGAAMHCWPDLDAAISEIYRVLRPGGRYVATTFLSSYFRVLQSSSPGAGSSINTQAFQYFESVMQLRMLLERNGFERNKISVEVLGPACVLIRCEK